MKTTTLIGSIILSILCATARADLKWNQTAIELHPAINDKQAVGHFKYENTGKEPLHFKSVHASCGCTTAQTQKDEVKPGEKGEITATFNIGDRTGTQVKTITVQTDDPDPARSSIVLTLKAVIPQALEVTPTFVFWQDKEDPKPKTISVKAAKDFPVKGIKVASSSPDFQTKVEKTGNGEFKVEVTPKDTSHMAGGTITIQPDDVQKVVYANVRVMGPPPAPMSPAPAGAAGNVAPTPGTNPAANGTPPVPAANSGASGVAPTPVGNPPRNAVPPTPVINSSVNPTATPSPSPKA